MPAAWPETELAGLFDAETFSSDCGLMKPEPEIYLRTARALEVEPGECYFVGDGANDELGGAARVGMTPVLFLPSAEPPLWPGSRGLDGPSRVIDPGGASAVLITTMNDIPGYAIDEVYGEVFGLTVRSRNIGSQFGAGLKSILGGELKGMTKALVDSRAEVIAADGRGGGG